MQFQFTPLREGRRWARATEKSGTKFQFTPLREGRPLCHTRSVLRPLFQFTPLREGRPGDPARRSRPSLQFQFTPLREGRPGDPARRSRPSLQFQFTPLREGRPGDPARRSRPSLQFQFTPLREGRRVYRRQSNAHQHYFNSRPCERGDAAAACCCYRPLISIHAPARGATAVFRSNPDRKQISIHAPARGATSGTCTVLSLIVFQFTPLREGRRGGRRGSQSKHQYFNSRPCERGDTQ